MNTVATNSFRRDIPVLRGPNVDYSSVNVDSEFEIGTLIPTLQVVGDESRFIAIANIPPNFHWIDVLRYMRLVMPMGCRQGIQRVIRTVEGGEQIFWVGCSSREVAGLARGYLHTRKAPGLPPFLVEFVPQKAYSARNSWMKQAWSRDEGRITKDKERKGQWKRARPGAQQGSVDAANDNQESHRIPGAHFLEQTDPNDQRHISRTTTATPLEQRLSNPPSLETTIQERGEWRPSLYERLGSLGRPAGVNLENRRPRQHNRALKTKKTKQKRAPSPILSDSHPDAA